MATLSQRISDLATSVRTKFNAITPRLLPTGGAANQFLRKKTATNYDVEWATDPWTYVKLAADFNTVSTTQVDVGLGFTPAANKTYLVEGILLLRTTNTANSIRPGWAFPTGLTDVTAQVRVGRSTSTETVAFNDTSLGFFASPPGLGTTTSSWYGEVSALIVTAAAPVGQAKVQISTQSATRTATVRAGSFIRYREI